jgi:uncharacterized protein YifE (UPF0438 family)
LTSEHRLVRSFWVTNRFICNRNYTQITIFSGKLTIDKVVDNFLSFPESSKTIKSEFLCERYGQNTELDREDSEPVRMT